MASSVQDMERRAPIVGGSSWPIEVRLRRGAIRTARENGPDAAYAIRRALRYLDACFLLPAACCLLRSQASQERNVLGRLLGSLGLEMSPFRAPHRLRDDDPVLLHHVFVCGHHGLHRLHGQSRGPALALARSVVDCSWTGRTPQAQVADPECRPSRRASYGPSPGERASASAMPGHGRSSSLALSSARVGIACCRSGEHCSPGKPAHVRMQSDTKTIHARRPKPSWRCAGSRSTDGTALPGLAGPDSSAPKSSCPTRT